jgi:NAD(P)-dependent dehydrogenase (short-subunit alcohol dehydrogenase family)
MLLENKNAVIYGGGGAIGGAVARTFAREGASVKEKLAAVDSNLTLDDAAYQSLLDGLDQMRMTRRSPRLAEVAEVAAFLASERAGAITGTFVNVTAGVFPS